MLVTGVGAFYKLSNSPPEIIMKLITKNDIEQFKTDRGGFTMSQVRFAQKLTGKRHWKDALIGKMLVDEDWDKFCELANSSKRKRRQKEKAAKQIINPIPKADNWSWKPPTPPPVKRESKNHKNQGKKARRRELLKTKPPGEFYASKEWLSLRVRVLEKYDCKCMMCGRSPKAHGIVIHVDHIKPRSKYPELSLSFENLQLLCEDCNLGKSNKYQTDWRPDGNEDDYQILESLPMTMQ